MTLQFHPYDQRFVDAVRAGGPDANGMPAERTHSDGNGNPCRSCLSHVPQGAEMLILAARPFPEPQPYAETGPIFLHKTACRRYAAEEILPPILSSPDYIVRGYGSDDRIVYGSGAVTPTDHITARAEELLSRPDIAYVHVRSARNNCFQCRIDKLEAPVFSDTALAI